MASDDAFDELLMDNGQPKPRCRSLVVTKQQGDEYVRHSIPYWIPCFVGCGIMSNGVRSQKWWEGA